MAIATDCRLWSSIATRKANWNRGVTMSVTGVIPGRPYNTQSDRDGSVMRVSGRLSFTHLHCVADMRDAPEKYQFLPEGVPIVSRESIMKLLENSCRGRKVGVRPKGNELEQAAADWDYEKRRARRSNPVNEQSAVK